MGKIVYDTDKPLIFLTGCINPSGMTHTNLQDSEIRRKQYCDSIRFYLEVTKCRILFVENSGTDISSYFKGEVERLEIITFDGNSYDKSLGKGRGEMLIIKHAISHSKFIKECSTVCKITGRYKILNINTFVDFYLTSGHDLMVELMRNLQYADSRLFIGTVNFYKKYLISYMDLIDDSKGFYFEHALSRASLTAVLEGFSILPFKYKPRYSGQSGTDGKKFNDSFIHWFPRNIAYRIRFFFLQELNKNKP